MARKPKSAVIVKFVDAALHELDYDVPNGTVTTAFLNVTNLSNDINTISVYINDGSDDYLLKSYPVAAGIGKSWRVIELSDQKLNTGYKIKVKASNSGEMNYFLSVTEISESI